MRALLVFLVMCLPVIAQAQVEVREIPTRPGVTLRFLYAKAENPVASAVLFQGGSGNIGIFPSGSTRNEGFLATGAKRFIENGITVAIPDVPSDRAGLNKFRDSPEHAQDAAALIEFLRQQSKLPVWAIGSSNGALSAASTTIHLKEAGPVGIVLISSVTKAPFSISSAHPVTLAPLAEVKVPVLLVHNKNDPCRVSPYDAMPGLMETMKGAKKVELITEEGGSIGEGGCGSGYHNYLGIEMQVTRDIADWIKRQAASN